MSGAGPVEKREKEESPVNCGHSYWSKSPPLLEMLSEVLWALTVLRLRLKIGLNAEATISNAKTGTSQMRGWFFII